MTGVLGADAGTDGGALVDADTAVACAGALTVTVATGPVPAVRVVGAGGGAVGGLAAVGAALGLGPPHAASRGRPTELATNIPITCRRVTRPFHMAETVCPPR